MIKNTVYSQYSEIFWENSVFQGKCKLFKNAVRWKNFQCSVFSVYSLGGGSCKLG